MDRAHIYEYLYKESSKEKTMNSRLRHFTPPHSDFGDFFTLLSKMPVDYDSHGIPLLTWKSSMLSMTSPPMWKGP